VSWSILGFEKTKKVFVTLDDRYRSRSVYVIGKTGTGKTSLLVNLCLQDVARGLGVIFLDPHGDPTLEILARIPENRVNDVILLDPSDSEYPFGLKLIHCADTSDAALVDSTCSTLMHVFKKLWGPGSNDSSWGPQLENVLTNCLYTLIFNQGTTLAEIPLLLRDAAVRNRMLENVTREWVKWFWQEDYADWAARMQIERTESTLNKVLLFLTKQTIANIVGQGETTIDLRRIMDEGKILLVRLPSVSVGEEVVTLIGTMLIAQVLSSALSRVDVSPTDRRLCCLYADEFQKFATPDFATLLSEARKFGLCTTVAHQFRDQLDRLNRGATLNVGSLIVLQVLGTDGKELASQFDCTPPPPEITGSNPIFTYKQDVLAHLTHQGHQNEEVVALFADNLAPIQSALAHLRTEKMYGKKVHGIARPYRGSELFVDEGRYIVLSSNLSLAMPILNRLLARVMMGEVHIGGGEYLSELSRLIIHLRGYLGFHPTWWPHLENSFDEAEWMVEISQDTKEAVSCLLQSFYARDDLKKLNLREKAESLREKWARGHVKRHLRESRDKKTQEETERACRLRSSYECDSVYGFIESMDRLCVLLSREPIQVDSGSHTPRFAPRRTFADMEGEVATNLSNLPPFHARVKILV
jgi:hypothetical protein